MSCSDSQFSDDIISNASKNESYDSDNNKNMFEICNKFNDIEKHENKFKNINFKNNLGTYANQFDDMKFNNNIPCEINNVNISQKNGNKENVIKQLQMERNMLFEQGVSAFENNQDMTYGIYDSNQLTHLNMNMSKKKVDFNGNIIENKYIQNNINDNNQRKLNQHTGNSNDLQYRKKKEVDKLFQDESTFQENTRGSKVMTDFYEKRIVPSKEKRNELPFLQKKITPGLNLNYNEESKNGFVENFRILPKTVDELRIKTNKKESYQARIIDGMKGHKGQIISKTEKRRPLRFKETTTDDLLPSKSNITAPTIHPNINKNDIDTKRGFKDINYKNPALYVNEQMTPENMKAKVKESSKEYYKNTAPSNFKKQGAINSRVSEDNISPSLTQRSKKNNYIGPALIEKNKKLYAFDKINNVPDLNVKNMYEDNDRVGNIQNNEKNYIMDKVNYTSDMNMRNIHEKTEHIANIENKTKKYLIDRTDVPNINMRNIHEQNNHLGNLNSEQKNYVYDKINNINDLNMRNIYEKNKQLYIDKINNKNYVFDNVNNTSDINQRNMYEKNNRYGNVTGNENNYVYDNINNISDINMRNITENNVRVGNINNNGDKTYNYDKINNITDINMRNIHDKFDRYGNMKENNKEYVYDKINNVS